MEHVYVIVFFGFLLEVNVSLAVRRYFKLFELFDVSTDLPHSYYRPNESIYRNSIRGSVLEKE